MRNIRKNALSFGIIRIIAVFLLAGCSKETDLSEQSGTLEDVCTENVGVTKQDDLEGGESVQTENRMILN